LKHTKHNLKKLEELLEEVGYEVRYEKGNFQSGYCVVEARKVVVVNKFFATEGRFSVLLDIISKIGINIGELSEQGAKTFKKLNIVPQDDQNEEA
jgi:hypothetical protein